MAAKPPRLPTIQRPLTSFVNQYRIEPAEVPSIARLH